MKNSNTVLTLVFVFAAFTLSAQNYAKVIPAFKKGRIDAQIGIGLTPTFIGNKGKATVPPLFASIDYLVGKKISLGLYGAHSVTESVEDIYIDGIRGQWKNHHTEAGVRIGVHFLEQEKWDFYGGLNLGLRHNKIEDMLEGMKQLNIYKGIESLNTTFAYGGFVGARYAFQERLTAFSEAGTGASLIKVGLGFRLAK